MVRRARVAVATVVLSLVLSTGAATAPVAGPGASSAAERAWLASRVYNAVMTWFAHWPDAPGSREIEAAHRAYLEEALAAGDRRAFARATLRFLATFRNGHTLFFDPILSREAGPLPFAVRHTGGRWVVTASAVPGLQAGDVIETIDGRSYEEFYQQQQRPFLPSSTEQWARRAPFAALPDFAPYAHLFPARFVLGLDGGRQVTIERSTPAALPAASTEGRWIERGSVAYLRVPSFLKPEFQKRALELVREFSQAQALIVDVRGNSGGSTPGELTSLLMDRPHRWWTESTPASLPYFRLRAEQGQWESKPFARPELLWRHEPASPADGAYRGRLALLVDGGCFSACEDFVMPFKDNGRAVLVGETTGGSTGQPYMLDLGDGVTVFVGAKREMFPDGSPFESVGVRPDVQVSPTVEHIRAGRDVVLDAARARLLRDGQAPAAR